MANLALNAAASDTYHYQTRSSAYMVDGSATAGDSWTGYSWDTYGQPGNAQATIDLGQVYTGIGYMKELQDGSGYPHAAHVIEVSEDGSSWTEVASYPGTGSSASAWVDYNFPAVSARYIRITVPTGRVMIEEFEVYQTISDADDLPASISVREWEDIPGSLSINPANSVLAQYTVNPIYKDDFPGSVGVRQVSELSASFLVNPQNRLLIQYEAFPPPLLKHSFSCVVDALLREGRPRLNYGTAATMPVGYDGTERFRALFRFEFGSQSLDPLDEIEYAVMKLYKPGTSGGSIDVGAHEVIESWTELGVTWANQPGASETPALTKTLEPGADYVELDATGLVNTWRAGEANHGVLLRAVNEALTTQAQLNAREYPAADLRPVLEVYTRNYQVPGYENLKAELNVQAWAEDDLPASMTVHTDWGFESFPSSMTVHRDDTLPCSVTVMGSNILGELAARRSDRTEIESSLTVRGEHYDEIDLHISASTPNFISTLAVRITDESDLDATAVVRQTGNGDLPGQAAVSRPDMPGSLSAFQVSDLPATIDVPWHIDNDFTGSLQVQQFEDEDFPGSASVVNGPNDIPGTVEVRSGYLRGHISVKFGSALLSFITAKQRDASDLEGSLNVPVPTQEGMTDLETTLAVEWWDANHLWGSIAVPGTGEADIPGTIDVWQNSDLPGHIEVGRSESYLPGSIIVRQEGTSEIEAAILVKQTSNLALYVLVVQKSDSEVDGAITISKPDLPGEVYVTRGNLLSSISVRREAEAALEATMTASKPAMPSGLMVSRRHVPGTITVTKPFTHAHLKASIEVRSWVSYIDELYELLPPVLKIDPSKE